MSLSNKDIYITLFDFNKTLPINIISFQKQNLEFPLLLTSKWYFYKFLSLGKVDRGINSSVCSLYLSSYAVLFLCED